MRSLHVKDGRGNLKRMMTYTSNRLQTLVYKELAYSG